MDKLESASNTSSVILFMVIILIINEITINIVNKYKKKYPHIFKYFVESSITTFIGNKNK